MPNPFRDRVYGDAVGGSLLIIVQKGHIDRAVPGDACKCAVACAFMSYNLCALVERTQVRVLRPATVEWIRHNNKVNNGLAKGVKVDDIVQWRYIISPMGQRRIALLDDGVLPKSGEIELTVPTLGQRLKRNKDSKRTTRRQRVDNLRAKKPTVRTMTGTLIAPEIDDGGLVEMAIGEPRIKYPPHMERHAMVNKILRGEMDYPDVVSPV